MLKGVKQAFIIFRIWVITSCGKQFIIFIELNDKMRNFVLGNTNYVGPFVNGEYKFPFLQIAEILVLIQSCQ